MASADYKHCARCGGKVFYDAEVDYDVPTFGALLALCADCRRAGARLMVV